MKYDFGIRVDVGKGSGSGHFVRCLSIAQELLKNGKKVVLHINNEKEIKNNLRHNIPFIALDPGTEIQKIKQCKIELKNIKNLIVDLPFKNQIYSEFFRNICNTIIIDDLGNKKIFSQLLFNGSLVSNFHKYEFNKKITKAFLGPKYMILRSEFREERKKIHTTNKSIKKILLTFGGIDSQNLSKKLLPVFDETNYEISLVLGPSYKHTKTIRNISKKHQNITIYNFEKHMEKLLSCQDLVISSGGITTYELACLGIPTIFIPTEEFENFTASSLAKKGFGLNYGFWDNDTQRMKNMILSLDDYKKRRNMLDSGRKIIDGKGLDRITANIMKNFS